MATGSIDRIGRAPNPWEFPSWSIANNDGTFANRFDDPDGIYRVLYASSSRLGCFLETLARFRPDFKLYAELQEIDGENDFVPPGIIPKNWFDNRLIGSANAHGDFADVGSSEWIETIRRHLAPLLNPLLSEKGITDFDASVLQFTVPRSLTQKVSRFVFERGLNGIRYLSKYGHDIVNWALFEPAQLSSQSDRLIQRDDPDLLRALHLFNLKLEGPDASAEIYRP